MIDKEKIYQRVVARVERLVVENKQLKAENEKRRRSTRIMAAFSRRIDRFSKGRFAEGMRVVEENKRLCAEVKQLRAENEELKRERGTKSDRLPDKA